MGHTLPISQRSVSLTRVSSDPYVKVSLMCSGKRLKKRKTTRKRGTLQPVYNEALVFDVPPDSAEVVGLLIAVVDYDRYG